MCFIEVIIILYHNHSCQSISSCWGNWANKQLNCKNAVLSWFRLFSFPFLLLLYCLSYLLGTSGLFSPVIYIQVSIAFAHEGALLSPSRSLDLPATWWRHLRRRGQTAARKQTDGASHRCVRGTNEVRAPVRQRTRLASFWEVATPDGPVEAQTWRHPAPVLW